MGFMFVIVSKEIIKCVERDNELFIYHSAYDNLKTYFYFDMVHLVKTIRNNLLNKKKFVFLLLNSICFAML